MGDRNQSIKNRGIYLAALAVPMGLLFPGISLVSLVVVAPRLTSLVDWSAWTVGVLVLIFMVTAWSIKIGHLAKIFLSRLTKRWLASFKAGGSPGRRP
jgi:hypothetical protein